MNPLLTTTRLLFPSFAAGALLAGCAAAPPVAPTASRPDALPIAAPVPPAVDPAPLAELSRALAAGELPRTTSVLILRHGELIYEVYAGGKDRETLHDTRSAMKSVTSLAVGAAIADGRIPSVSAPALPFFADLRPFAHDDAIKGAITLEDLLTMSSALACDDNDPESPGNEDNMHPQPAWTRWAVDLPIKPTYARDASGRGPFVYCTGDAFLAGQLVQRATGTPIDRYVAERLFAPLGITRWEWPHSPTGEVMTGGGLRLRSRDLATLGWMVLSGGRWNGREVVPAKWIEESLTVRRPDALPGMDYGYLFWHRQYASRCGRSSGWFMSGNGGNHVVMLKDLDAVVVVTSENYNTRGMHQQSIRILEDYALRALPCAR